MSGINFGAVIYAKDFLRLAEFYEQITNLEKLETDPSHVKLESGSFQLVVLQTPEHIAATIDIQNPPNRRDNTPIKLMFVVASLNQSRSLIASLGGKLNDSEQEWIYDEFSVCDGHDPEGNIFQLRAITQ